MNIKETEIWIEIGKLKMPARETIIDKYKSEIEKNFNCTIVDRVYGDLGSVTNPAIAVKDNMTNLCYLKEFVPKQ